MIEKIFQRVFNLSYHSMRTELSYVLLSDGSSDKNLMPIINWALKEILPSNVAIEHEWANLYYAKSKPKKLKERIDYVLDRYPCDVLFVHRDAESKNLGIIENRITEIENAWPKNIPQKYIPVIPVVMSEAWLLIDEKAIRNACGNPNGKHDIEMPSIGKLESCPDPKKMLEELLIDASGAKGRNLEKFKRDLSHAKFLVSQNIDSFDRLRKLYAFKLFESNLKNKLVELGYNK